MNNSSSLGTLDIKKLLFKLGIPAMFAQLINMLYNIVDRIYLGNIESIGSYALSGIGIVMPIILVISAFASMIGGGGAPLAAIALGKGDKYRAHKILQVCFSMAIFLSFILLAICFIYKDKIIYLFGSSKTVFPYADEYLSYYLLGTTFMMISTGLNGFISAQGQANIAMRTTAIGAIANIILDPIFIYTFNMGIKGAALASSISQAFSAIYVIKFLISHKSELRLKLAFDLDIKILKHIVMLGISYFVMQSTESAISIVFNRQLLSYGGDMHIAAMSIMNSIIMIVTVPLSGFNGGVQALISYNYGANKPKRIKDTIKLMLKINFLIQSVYCITTMVFPHIFAQIFTNDLVTITITKQFMPIFVSGLWIFSVQSVAQSFFVATNKPVISLFVATLRKIIILIPLALILPRFIGLSGVYIAEAVADHISATTSAILLIYYYKRL